jgi:hypothetical protein
MVSRRAAISRPTVTVVSEGKGPSLHVEGARRGALNTILDAVTALNLKDLEAEVAAAVAADQGETSTQGASASSKGKAKVANPDWEDVPFNPVSITPLSSQPRFSQVVLLWSLQ